MGKDAFILTGTVLVGSQLLENHFVLIEDGKISNVGPKSDIPTGFQGQKYVYSSQEIIIPGYIDVHIHGANNADTMDATPECIDTMAKVLVKEGTTSFLPTTMTQATEKIEAALKNVAQYMKVDNQPGKAEVLGIHLEGPFVNPIRKGAQPGEHIIEPSVEQFKFWQTLANNHIKLVTLAPERNGGMELVRYLKETGVIASIGHSDADYVEVEEAIQAGATHVTHLFNGMKGLHHREPGTAGASLLFDELHVEIIADGFHIRPEMIDLAIRLKGLERTVLITDSMRAKWLPDGLSELGGQEVIVKDGKATLTSGSLAGSILKMSDAVKNIMKFANLSLPEAVKLATINPARELGIDNRKGSIEEGKDADLVVLNEQFDPILTVCRGMIAYKGE